MKLICIPCDKTNIDVFFAPDKVVAYYTYDSKKPEDNKEGHRHNHVLCIDTVGQSYVRYFRYMSVMAEYERELARAIEAL